MSAISLHSPLRKQIAESQALNQNLIAKRKRDSFIWKKVCAHTHMYLRVKVQQIQKPFIRIYSRQLTISALPKDKHTPPRVYWIRNFFPFVASFLPFFFVARFHRLEPRRTERGERKDGRDSRAAAAIAFNFDGKRIFKYRGSPRRWADAQTEDARDFFHPAKLPFLRG